MKYKLLALDIDGTLVPEHTNDISEKVKQAINQAKEKMTVALVSARARADQQIIIDALGLKNRYHVIENGTKVLNPQGEIEYTLYLPHDEVAQIQNIAGSLCESIGFCIDGKWLQTHPETEEDIVTTLSLIAPRELAEQIPTLIAKEKLTYSITVGNHWSDSNLAVVLISHKDASKGGGLRYLQKILGITPDETIAVGDGASDVPMMQHAAVKVAMGNAEDKLKLVVTDIVSSVTDDGVTDVVNKYIL
jgi:HAD superfamily hydrolase (TIGR01484 family)